MNVKLTKGSATDLLKLFTVCVSFAALVVGWVLLDGLERGLVVEDVRLTLSGIWHRIRGIRKL